MSDSPADLSYRRLPIRRSARAILAVALSVGLIIEFGGRQSHSSVPTSSCKAQNHCYRSTTRVDFPSYGNVYPSNLSDCMFAAAAHWQIIVLKRTPSASAVIEDYRKASVSDSSGINEDVFYWYWTSRGIDGSRISDWRVINVTSRAEIEHAVRRNKAVFAIFVFHEGATLGGTKVGVGGHAAIIDGYTQTGPLVVTWGTTYQMTWREYWASIASLRSIIL